MKLRWVLPACLLALGVLSVVWVVGLVWGQIDEGKFPSDSAFPLFRLQAPWGK
jgi:hypothetical protein